MSASSIPDKPRRLNFYWGTSSHLAFIPTPAAKTCPLCHRTLSRRGDLVQPPRCERCGQPFHYKCYVAALPAGPERDFFTGPDVEPPWEHDFTKGPFLIFLCGGCRS